MELEVLYQDEVLVAINKPAGLLSVPGRTEDKKLSALSQLAECGIDAFVVHRLDRDTSGVMVFARNKQNQRSLSLAFANRHTKKQYVAIVDGVVQGTEGKHQWPLRKDMESSLPPRYVVDHDLGKSAQTIWRVIEKNSFTSRLRLFPLTGRSHQLRVHCLEWGHAIVGDPIYGKTPAIRMMLHSESLAFQHPVSRERMNLKSEVPF